MRTLSRRHFFFGSLALLASCNRRSASDSANRRYPVSIARARSYSADLTGTIRRILVEHRVQIRDQRIVLKPNLVEFNPYKPINTHPVFVASVAEAFHSLGARSVKIAEGPGHRRATFEMAEAAGYFEAIPAFEERFVDLNLDDVHRVPVHQSFSSHRELYLPQTVLDCDLLVSLPKMKTHHWAGVTLAMKNLFGVVPGAVYGWPKNILHWAGINESVADLHYLFPKQFSLVDGIEAMQGNGPILGTSKHAGLIVAGAHAPSVDATCCNIMRINSAKIGYLQLVGKRSNWNQSQITQRGEMVETVATPFDLIPEFASLRL
jgi:uncharacterized protein (DUF362 family)